MSSYLKKKKSYFLDKMRTFTYETNTKFKSNSIYKYII